MAKLYRRIINISFLFADITDSENAKSVIHALVIEFCPGFMHPFHLITNIYEFVITFTVFVISFIKMFVSLIS